MSYTTVDAVAGQFPTFQRGNPDQAPTDAQIQVYIDDVAGELDAALMRRFNEIIQSAYNGNFASFIAALSTDAQNLLEKLNRLGACAQLGDAFASLGNTTAAKLGASYEEKWDAGFAELNAVDHTGKALPRGGNYDHLFDPLSRTQTPRPVMYGESEGPRIMQGPIGKEFPK